MSEASTPVVAVPSEVSVDPSLVTACVCVKDLLVQIVYKDCPVSFPTDMNENNNEQQTPEHANPENSFSSAKKQPVSILRDRNSVRRERTVSFETEPTCPSPATLEGRESVTNATPTVTTSSTSDEAQQQQDATYTVSVKELSLGHAELSSLSRWTLDEVYGVHGIRVDWERAKKLHREINQRQPLSPKPSTHRGDNIFRPKVEDENADTTPTMQLFGSEFARCLMQDPPSKGLSTPFRSPTKAIQVRSHCKSPSSHLGDGVATMGDASLAHQTGALLDICFTVGKAPPPPGFLRLAKTVAGAPLVFEKSHAKKPLCLNVKKEPSWDKATQRPCVTAICIIFPDRNEFVPPGFCIARLAGSSVAADIGKTERIFLCFRRSREGNPITGLVALRPHEGETIPAGYTVIERSPRSHVANLTSRNQGKSTMAIAESPLFLAYRQRLATLESLRPLPLVLSVYEQSQDTGKAAKMQCYYCTGGSVVAAYVGRFHVLDRTTHGLLSPSSITNRLKMIQESRRTSREEGEDIDPEQKMSYIRSEEPDFVKQTSSAGISPAMLTSSIDSAMLETRMIPLLGEDNPDLIGCLSAFDFIPSPSIPYKAKESRREAMDALSTRAALLVPLLTACYTRHGGSALLAVECLSTLLTETSFFDHDISDEDVVHDNNGSLLTLLDVSVQSVCDVATTGAEETCFSACIAWVEQAIRRSSGRLNPRSIGFVTRLYYFCFYFGASVPNASHWPQSSWLVEATLTEARKDDGDFPLLLDPREVTGQAYLPGGAPQAAALAFKELVSLSVLMLGRVSVADWLYSHDSKEDWLAKKGAAALKDPYGSFLGSILDKVVEDAVDHVERANFTQLALHQVQKSGGSELFWHDMIHFCGDGMFGKDKALGDSGKECFMITFAILANLVKVSSGKLRATMGSKESLPRETTSKLLSLELLLHFLEFWSDEQEALIGVSSVKTTATESMDTLAFAVRRLVAPCLLWNTRASLDNPQVFRRVLGIMTELWCSPVHRSRCKVEIGVLMDHYALGLLRVDPQVSTSKRSLFQQQVELLKEVKNWFSNDPKDVIEMFLNYDTNVAAIQGHVQLMAGGQCKLLQQLCEGLSNIAEKCGDIISKQFVANQHEQQGKHWLSIGKPHESVPAVTFKETTMMRKSAHAMRKVSLEAVVQIVKCLSISAAASCGSSFTELVLSWEPNSSRSPIAYQRSTSFSEIQSPRVVIGKCVEGEGNELVQLNFVNQDKPSTSNCGNDDEVRRFWKDAIAVVDAKNSSNPGFIENRELLKTAIDIAHQKNIKKAVEYLIACGGITSAPRDVANFLRINKEKLPSVGLGQYVSEGGTAVSETEYWHSVRYTFIRATSFVGMNVLHAYVSVCACSLYFAPCAHQLYFFFLSLRHFLSTSGFRLPGEAQRIDRIMMTFSRCFFEDNVGDVVTCPFKREDTVFLLVFAIIMLNTDLHNVSSHVRGVKKMSKADFISNLRGAIDGHDIDGENLSSIYDSILREPIVLDESMVPEDRKFDEASKQIIDNVQSADSLLRGLAAHDIPFACIEEFPEMVKCSTMETLKDLTRQCIAKTWHQWYGVINTGLETAQIDPVALSPTVELLQYALAITVCLDAPRERAAFLSQMGRLRAFEKSRRGRWVTAQDIDYRKEVWYRDIEQACKQSEERKLWALKKIHHSIRSIQNALKLDVKNKVGMVQAVSEIIDGDFLLKDPSREFIRSGELVKKSARTGRPTEYRFYLFSDLLLYGMQQKSGQYKTHEELPLYLMKIIDWFPPSQKQRLNSFEVIHPRKSFTVLCSSEEEKKLWVEEIRRTTNKDVDKRMRAEAQRLSLHARLQARSGMEQ